MSAIDAGTRSVDIRAVRGRGTHEEAVFRSASNPGLMRIRASESRTVAFRPTSHSPATVRVQHDSNGGSWQVILTPIGSDTLEGLRSLDEAGHIKLVEEQMAPDDFRADEMAWLQEHAQDVARDYPGEWIAVDGKELVAHAASLLLLLQLSRENGHPQPFVTAIPGRPIENLCV